MNGKQLIPAVLAGALVGAVLAGPASAAVAALTAAPSTQTFYVDGKQVDLEAYVISGHNYVQLRDIGRAVDFGVAYDQDTNRVLVSGSNFIPYKGERYGKNGTDGEHGIGAFGSAPIFSCRKEQTHPTKGAPAGTGRAV